MSKQSELRRSMMTASSAIDLHIEPPAVEAFLAWERRRREVRFDIRHALPFADDWLDAVVEASIAEAESVGWERAEVRERQEANCREGPDAAPSHRRRER